MMLKFKKYTIVFQVLAVLRAHLAAHILHICSEARFRVRLAIFLKSKRYMLLLGIILFFNNSVYALPEAEAEPVKNEATVLKSNIDEVRLIKIVKKLYENAGSNAYLISLPLLINAEFYAQGGDPAQAQKLYKKMLRSMENALVRIPENDPKNNQNSYKAWLTGRLLEAAQDMQDEMTVQKTKSALHALLDNSNTPEDEKYAWALSYYAASGKAEYEQYTMEERLEPMYALSQSYKDLAKVVEDKKTFFEEDNAGLLQEKRSNALWGWVMALRAAAKEHDKKAYTEILAQLAMMTDEKTVAQTLAVGLVRSAKSNDYPAWALSIVLLSAAEMDDVKLYEEIREPLVESIHQAKHTGAEAEALLAQLNVNRAETLMAQ